MLITIDTREQLPFTFAGRIDIQTEVRALPIGDYSLSGLTDRIAIERKSLPDLVACLSSQRERFEKELCRARGLEYFAVVVEGSFSALANGIYRSKLQPYSAVQSISAFETRYKVPFLFCEDRRLAEYRTWSILWQYLRNQKHRAEAILKCIDGQGQCSSTS